MTHVEREKLLGNDLALEMKEKSAETERRVKETGRLEKKGWMMRMQEAEEVMMTTE